jgi:hypothetical protein
MIGCCRKLPHRYLIDRTKVMLPEVAEIIASSVMAVYYDVNFKKDLLNISIFNSINRVIIYELDLIQ